MSRIEAKRRDQHTMFLLVICLTLRITAVDGGLTKLCPVLTLPQYAFFFSGYCEREVGSLCGVGCFTGYLLADGDSFRECQPDGTWTGEQPKCEEIRCPPLKISTQVIQECLPEQNSMDLKFGTKCQARCRQSGHRLIGPPTRECLVLGIWSGYEQFCVVNTEITAQVALSTTTTHQPSTTIALKHHDYSNYALRINKNDPGIALTPFQSSQFTIIFWFFLETDINATLISLKETNNKTLFQIVVRQNRLVFHHSSRNQTQPTSIKILTSKWNHFAWTYSSKRQQSYLYIDGARQQSFDFGIVNFNFQNVSSVNLFGPSFNGMITRLEVWKEMILEQQLLASYRDCRKQNGNAFSWSQMSDHVFIDTSKLRSSGFCAGCSEPATVHGGVYYVLDYDVGASVDYECNYGYEMIGANRAVCLVPSEWYPLPPVCKYNPCTPSCEVCEKKTGVCLREQMKIDSDLCDPPCDDNEECMDGECVWSNAGDKWKVDTNQNVCYPVCPVGTPCINQRCEPNLTPHCSVSCRPGQVCVDGRCGCYKGVCERNRSCYEACEAGEQCYNLSCSCGSQGKCGEGELCQFDVCMCGTRRGGCRSNEHCMNGTCVCKTNSCDSCGNKCQANEICLDGKCVCKERCGKAFCPLPCLNGGLCTGFYQCTCRQGWHGHRCEQRQQRKGNEQIG